MDGTTEDRTVAKSTGRLFLERALIMLVGLSIGIPLALGASWLTDGIPVVLTLLLVPLWANWSDRRAARQ